MISGGEVLDDEVVDVPRYYHQYSMETCRNVHGKIKNLRGWWVFERLTGNIIGPWSTEDGARDAARLLNKKLTPPLALPKAFRRGMKYKNPV